MTKLSERVPDTMSRAKLRSWLKELAEYVEFIDNRVRMEGRYLCIHRTSSPTELEYEPQTYDEAIALIKGWKRCVVGSFVHWETPTGNHVIFRDERIHEFYIHADSWEWDRWPELWKEMVEAKIRRLYLSEVSGKWVFHLHSVVYTDSTPGRVVCKAYLVYKGHADWAERLSKHD